MKLTPQLYLAFDGTCEAAFRYYEQHLGGGVGTLFRFADSPMEKDVPPDWGDKVMHGSIVIGGMEIAGADAAPPSYERPVGFHILLGVGDVADAERVFQALADGGQVSMPLQETFWAVRFGVVTDRFGVPWSINCEATS